MNPSIGRIVHYVSHGTPVRADGTQAYSSECRAAVVTEVNRYAPGSTGDRADEVGLCVLNPTGQFFSRNVPFGKGDVPCVPSQLTGGTWQWPARIEADPTFADKVHAHMGRP